MYKIILYGEAQSEHIVCNYFLGSEEKLRLDNENVEENQAQWQRVLFLHCM